MFGIALQIKLVEQIAGLCIAAPLLLLKEKEMEDEVLNLYLFPFT
jgi:hypothetical protein